MITWSKKYSNGAWVIDDYVTAKAILASDQFSVQRAGRWLNTSANDGLEDDLRIFKSLLRQSVVFLDGSKHQKIRSLLIQKIKHAMSNEFQGKLDAIALDAIEQLQNKPSNLISGLAKIVPARSIAYLIGIDPNNEEVFRWSDAIANFLGAPIESGQLALKAQNAVGEMAQYFESSISRGDYVCNDRRILDELLEEFPQDQLRSRQVLLAQLCTLLFGGYETTRNLIGNAISLLLLNESQHDFLKKRPELIDDCINEVLRLESPVQYTGRLVRSKISFGNVTFKAGDLVVIEIGAANRDPSIYEDPNSFDIARKFIPHLGFGFGSHYCLGAILSLMECRAVLRNLIKTNIQLNSPPIWSSNTLYRGLDELSVTVMM